MIADLRGRAVVVIRPPIAVAPVLHSAFAKHGANVLIYERPDISAVAPNETIDALILGPSAAAENSARLLLDLAKSLRERTGRHPRHLILLSNFDPARFRPGAAEMAAGEAASEAFIRYSNEQLGDDSVAVNILRYRLSTPNSPGATEDEVANAAVVLCSGLLDSLRGQVLNVDRGVSFADNVLRRLDSPPSPPR